MRGPDGAILEVPAGWALLPPGDAAITRKVKAAGATWTVKEKRGRREFSQGIWAPGEVIERCRAEVAATRDTPAYRRKLAADRQRRARKHEEYAAEFEAEVRDFLDFHPRHDDLGRAVAGAIARHATPVGSGTVARTKRIPVERRAEAATIAWLRHHTTGYDRMQIRRVKGKRREVRRELAAQSRRLLQRYRRGEPAPDPCPLQAALDDPRGPGAPPRIRREPVPPPASVHAAPSADPIAPEPPPAPDPPTPPPRRPPSKNAEQLDAERRATQERILARFKR